MAGILLVAGFDDTTAEEFARVLQVNLLGQVHGAKAALPHLRRGGGAFIAMSSMGCSQRGIPLQSATARPTRHRPLLGVAARGTAARRRPGQITQIMRTG